MLPDFLIVGAQKCGTSSLAATLRRHPEVFLARPKELHFFDIYFDKGVEWYAEQFRGADGRLAGEATPRYMHDPLSRERLAEVVPEARLLVMLRDPVARAYSHFWHNKRLGTEPLESFEAALEAEPARMASGIRKEHNRYSYLDRGHYLTQLRALERGNGAERVHVALFEELLRERVATLTGIFGFLGIDTAPASTIEEQWRNRYRTTGPDGQEKVAAYPPMAEETRRRLTDYFRPINDELGRHLGRDLSIWDRS